jgi:hypothetical protein
MREPQGVEHERGGFVERIVGPVTEENPRAAQPAGTALDENAYRNGLKAHRPGTLTHRIGMLASYEAAAPVE